MSNYYNNYLLGKGIMFTFLEKNFDGNKIFQK